MRIFVDVCVHTDVVLALKGAGFQVVRAFERLSPKADDDTIYKYAKKNGYVLLSYDKDFGNMMRFDVKNSPGVVLIYVEKMSKHQIIHNTLHFFNHKTERELAGVLWLVESGAEPRRWPH